MFSLFASLPPSARTWAWAGLLLLVLLVVSYLVQRRYAVPALTTALDDVLTRWLARRKTTLATLAVAGLAMMAGLHGLLGLLALVLVCDTLLSVVMVWNAQRNAASGASPAPLAEQAEVEAANDPRA